jgi:hypothetical protein
MILFLLCFYVELFKSLVGLLDQSKYPRVV